MVGSMSVKQGDALPLLSIMPFQRFPMSKVFDIILLIVSTTALSLT